MAGIVEQASQSPTRVLVFDELRGDSPWIDALRDSGFVSLGSGCAKLCLRIVGTPSEIAESIRATLSEADLTSEGLVGIADELDSRSIETDLVTAWEVEHLLWPAKLLRCGIPSYVVPIRPFWAAELFDSGLADGMLWGADPDLALNPESVYYRSYRNSPFGLMGRLVWYVSEGKKNPETKRLRACSRLEAVTVGPAKDLFREFRRLGVYSWKDILGAANGNPEGRIMAMKFDDTERFSQTIRWDDFQGVLSRNGVRTNLLSPVEIPESAFVEIYRRAFALSL